MVDNSLLGVISDLQKVQATLYAYHKAYLMLTAQIKNLKKYNELH